ncbi:CCC motif membrane protein [Flavobacterium sp.]|uniref:CCC motif membrane protein n=1 Tax=Flavobacterium sp. TaxID=239 RepID=UPI00286DB3BF|nr:CCC motif membrane protein [Flavobacterium sp.]
MREHKNDLPNATIVLAFGIMSILLSFCYGFLGLIFGILTLVLANKDLRLYNFNPQKFTETSLQNINAGRVCAIIGLCISTLFTLFIIFIFVISLFSRN